MRTSAIGFAAALAVVLASAGADAAPVQLVPAVAVGHDAALVLVRGGCGFGEHRTYSGYCRYNRGWRGRTRFHRNHWRRHWY